MSGFLLDDYRTGYGEFALGATSTPWATDPDADWDAAGYRQRDDGGGRMNKYHARKVKLDGHTFDSQAEAARYQELLLLERAGEIVGLEVHRSWALIPEFTDRDGKRQRGIAYESDFCYREEHSGRFICEDVKGYRTPVYRIKAKLFHWRYPEIRLVEVEA